MLIDWLFVEGALPVRCECVGYRRARSRKRSVVGVESSNGICAAWSKFAELTEDVLLARGVFVVTVVLLRLSKFVDVIRDYFSG